MNSPVTPPSGGRKKGPGSRKNLSPQRIDKTNVTKQHTEKPAETQAKGGWAAHPIDAFTPEQIIERFGGGTVDNLGLLVPGPGHSETDLSMRIFVNPAFPDGFHALSFAGDTLAACRAGVLQTLGLKGGGKRVKLTPEQKAAREAAYAEVKAKFAAVREEKIEKAAEQWRKAQPVTAADLDFKLVSGKAPKGIVNKYLNGRGVHILDDTVFHWQGSWVANSGRGHPGAMLAKIVSWEDRKTLVGIHKTFIGALGETTTIEIGGDDNCERVKRITQGGNKGLIFLYGGTKNNEAGGYGEGVETTLSLARLPELKGVALVSYVTSGNLVNGKNPGDEMPVPTRNPIYLAVDLEPSGVGERNTKAYAARCVKAGKTVYLVYPTIPLKDGKADLNDVVRAPGFGPGVGYEIVEYHSEKSVGKEGEDGGEESACGGHSYEDYEAYLPQHDYIYMPTGAHWPAASANGRLPWVPMTYPDGNPVLDHKTGEQKMMKPNIWLDKNKAVEQQVWWPGKPTIIGLCKFFSVNSERAIVRSL